MAILNITSNNFGNLVTKSEKPSLVLFWAVGNPLNNLWDKMLTIFDQEGHPELNICKVSVNYAPHIPMRFHIATYPTIVLFKGKEVVGMAGGKCTMGAIKDLVAKLDEVPEVAQEAEAKA